jgi:hypothetical protein
VRRQAALLNRESRVTVVVMTGICAAGVLFLLRFLIAMCQTPEPANPLHLLRVAPMHAGGGEPNAGESTEHSNQADHRAVRRLRASDRPAATTAAWSATRVAPGNRGTSGKFPQRRAKRSNTSHTPIRES